MDEEGIGGNGRSEGADTVRYEKCLEGLGLANCSYYVEEFHLAAKKAEEGGDLSEAANFHMLVAVCSFEEQYWNRSDPYGVIRRKPEFAGVTPEHLPADWYSQLKAIADVIENSTLRARLLDIHWLAQKDVDSCRTAISAYLASAEILVETDEWYDGARSFHRACQLGNYLGPKNQDAVKAKEALLRAIVEGSSEDNDRLSRLLKIAYEVGAGESVKLAELARLKGQESMEDQALETAHSLWSIEANFLRSEKNEEGAKDAKIRAAMTYVERARLRATPGNFFAASTIMEKGIIALRRAGADSNLILELKGELREMQPKAMAEMSTFEHGTDITQEVLKIRTAFDGLTLFESIEKLCLAQPLANVSELRRQTEKEASNSLRHFFDGTVHASDGRVVHVQRGLIGLEGEEREKALEQEMFASLHRFYWGVRASCFIEPARQRICEQHPLHKKDLVFLVSNNSFVPSGHEEIFLRGLHAGFHGDYLTAAPFLIPQIENSIRHVLQENGVNVSNLQDDQTQPVKLLGPLFDIPATREIFGESCWFELRGLMIEKTGAEIRNMVAHGFVSTSDCYGPAAQNLWWIVLRLVMIPIIRAARQNIEEP